MRFLQGTFRNQTTIQAAGYGCIRRLVVNGDIFSFSQFPVFTTHPASTATLDQAKAEDILECPSFFKSGVFAGMTSISSEVIRMNATISSEGTLLSHPAYIDEMLRIHAFLSGEAIEEWQFQRTCPFGLTITTPGHSSLLFNASLDTISSWNGGDTYLARSGMTTVGSQSLYSGVWEGSVRFQRKSCSVSVELDAFPDTDAFMPHIHIHALSCAPPSGRRAAPAAPAPASASRRLLQMNESDDAASEEAQPDVAVADLHRAAAITTFVLNNLTVATRLALALPSAAGPRLLYVPPFPCALLGGSPRAVDLFLPCVPSLPCGMWEASVWDCAGS